MWLKFFKRLSAANRGLGFTFCLENKAGLGFKKVVLSSVFSSNKLYPRNISGIKKINKNGRKI